MTEPVCPIMEPKTEAASGSSVTEKAIELVKKATEADNEQKYEEALPLYQHAIDYFLQSLKHESHSTASKHSIKEKCQQCLERAETLDNLLAKSKKDGVHDSVESHTEGGKTLKSDEQKEDVQQEGCGDKELEHKLSGSLTWEKPNVKWDDIAGLQEAKEALKESVILPVKFPHLFTGKRKPCWAILLYGPSGTGKSYLAKAVATEADSTFFSISSSNLVGIWSRESEHFIRNVFELARANKPAIIFISELDIAFSAQSDHTSSIAQRTTAELLHQMQEVDKDSDGLFVLGTTSAPWNLNAGIRKKFKKRIYVRLPDEPSRRHIFELNIGNTPCKLTSEDLTQLAKMTEGYSGADISNVVQEALMMPIQRIKTATHFKKIRDPMSSDPAGAADDPYTPCGPRDDGAEEMSWMQIPKGLLVQQFATVSDFRKSVESHVIKETELNQFDKFTEEFGQSG